MTSLLLTLLLSQAPVFDRGLMLRFSSNCEAVAANNPAVGPTLVMTSPQPVQVDGGWLTLWAPKEFTRCYLPRSRPQDAIEDALGWAAIPVGALGEEVKWPSSPTDHSAFKALTGEKFIERALPGAMPTYSAAWIRKVFKAVYVAPGGKIDGINSQLVYDVVARDSVRREVTRWVTVLQALPGARRMSLARAYAKEVKRAGASFDAYTYLTTVQHAELGADSEFGNERVLGTILRRSLDGTLPTVLQLMSQVIDAYDPEFAHQVGPSLDRAVR